MKPQLDDKQPIYLQIKEMIEDSIIKGTMKSGERVPSTNELAKFYGINPATARQGMNELVNEHILEKQRGVGMFVTDDAKKILIAKRRLSFFRDYIDPLLDEAKKLGISNKQLMTMIEEGEHK